MTAPSRRLALLWFGLLSIALIILLTPQLRGAVLGVVARLRDAGWVGAVGFALLYAGLGVVFFPRSLLNAFGGWAFGTWLGFLLAWGASVLSAAISCQSGRLASRRVSAAESATPWGSFRFVARTETVQVTVLWRFSMVLPFVVLNYLMGGWRAPRARFLLGTTIGVPLMTLLQTWVGSLARDAGELLDGRAQAPSGAQPWLLAATLVFAVVMLLLLASRARRARQSWFSHPSRFPYWPPARGGLSTHCGRSGLWTRRHLFLRSRAERM